ncbi:unnamed protein product [Trifolium pratense]|uniref:Uncharacterized protein n=1 Tax=Trifolium pratense TaxID=57577 RepID=A0ACB0IHD2_TRIPR|nr:unnamed protein product [Trifolium pratense]
MVICNENSYLVSHYCLFDIESPDSSLLLLLNGGGVFAWLSVGCWSVWHLLGFVFLLAYSYAGISNWRVVLV